MAPGIRASFRTLRIAWVVLAGTLAVVAALWIWVRRDVRAHAHHMAQRRASALGIELQGHLGEYAARGREAAVVAQLQQARGGGDLAQILRPIERAEDFQGFNGLGVCLLQRGPVGRERCLTEAILSQDGRTHPMGLDHLAIPERAEAMVRARDSGKGALTPPLRLKVDAPGGEPGSVILYTPIYGGLEPPETVQDRRVAIRGYAFCPIPLARFFQGIGDLTGDSSAVEIRDAASGLTVYRSAGWRQVPDSMRALEASVAVEMGGRLWWLAVRPSKGFFGQVDNRSPTHVLLLGVLVGLLAFAIAASLESARARAEHLAEDLAREARENEARLLEIAKTMGEGLYVVDREGLITFVNPEAGRLLGWEAQTLVGQNAHDLFHRQSVEGERISQTACGILRVAHTGERYTSEDEVYWHREDHPVAVSVSASPVLREGVPSGAVVVFRDITQRKEMERALWQAQKLESLELMAGGIAHDFNNLFQGLLGNLELARLGLGEGTRAAEYLHRMEEILARATRLSGEMLLYSGRSFLHREALDLEALIRQAVAGGKAQVALDGGLPPLEGDPDQIGKLLSILLENAIEASAGGPVRLSVRDVDLQPRDLAEGFWPEPGRSGPAVMIEVEDSGPGVSPEVLRRMFDPFFSTKAMGRGLGLPAALGILRGHRGQIQVLGRPGRGTRMRVYLPVREGTMPGVPGRAVPSRPSKGVLLLVDDDAGVRGPVAELIRLRLGYEVLEAGGGEEAVSLFRAQPDRIALILMDATMPDLDGPAAFDAIREIRPGARAILCSGYSEATGKAAVLAHGFAAYLKKPFGLKELEALLAAHLGER